MRRELLLYVGVAAAASEPLYSFESSPLVKLTDDNYQSDMVKDTKHLWVVEFYADWCGHCKQFAPLYEKAAKNLDGIVKFGAVNADEAKATSAAAGVQGFPTIKMFLPEATRNPYTGKMYKQPVEYRGPRTAKGVVDAAIKLIPSQVIEVADSQFDAFKGNGSLPKALLFTKKTETPPVLKSLSHAFAGRLLFGVAREGATAAATAAGVDEYPKVVVLPTEGAPVVHSGAMKPADLKAFLEQHAASEPVASASAAAEDSLAEEVTEENLAELVESSRDPWILVHEADDASLPAPGVEALAEALYGQAKVGKASAAVAAKFKAGKAPSLVVLPHGTGTKSPKKATSFPGTEKGVDEAKKAVLETIPDTFVEMLSPASIDRFMSEGMQSQAAKAVCILFSEKQVVPPFFRSVAMRFDGKLSFGMAGGGDKQIMQRFGVAKAPALLILFPDEQKQAEAQEGQLQIQGMQFTPKMHGKFNFPNIANFVEQFATARAEQFGTAAPQGEKPAAAEAPRKPKDLGPLPELDAENFNAECVEKGGLCAIAFMDGGPDNSNKEAHLEMLTKMRAKRAGGPLAFSWVDATCRTNFAAAFELSEMDLPTMIVLSPSKLRWARSIGAFDAETLGPFGMGVASGRQSTNPIQELPKMDEVDCATFERGPQYVDESPLDDDIMAEILEEERREREAREAEVAEELKKQGLASPKGGAVDKSKMTELQKLEADLEECSAMDLLCFARREKQLKTIEKKRALEEKLAEIARKKKKKAKKAKKAAKK